jgi:hypothetical protein
MLSTVITHHQEVNSIPVHSFPFIRHIEGEHYEIYLSSADKIIGRIEHSQGSITIRYSGDLFLNEYMIIHDLVTKLSESSSGIVDDSNSFLGYLPSGEQAYIVTNWDSWLEYIQSSMRHCQ